MTKTNATTSTKTRAAKAAKAAKPTAAKGAAPKAAKAPAPKAVGHKPLPKAEQAPVIRLKGNAPYKALVKLDKVAAKPGTWRYAMIEAALSNKSTDAAKAAIPAAFAGKKIDFAFLAANKYIEFVAAA